MSSQINPRSFKSIREAIANRDVKSRGQFAREMVNAFRAPILERKKKEMEAAQEATQETAQETAQETPPMPTSVANKAKSQVKKKAE